VIFGPSYHPLQAAFNYNQDLFNVMLEWQLTFDVTVIRLNGSLESTDAGSQPSIGDAAVT
jgi:hypothetical protein